MTAAGALVRPPPAVTAAAALLEIDRPDLLWWIGANRVGAPVILTTARDDLPAAHVRLIARAMWVGYRGPAVWHDADPCRLGVFDWETPDQLADYIITEVLPTDPGPERVWRPRARAHAARLAALLRVWGLPHPATNPVKTP